MLTIFEQAHLDGKIEGKIEGEIEGDIKRGIKMVQMGLSRFYPNHSPDLDGQIAKIEDPNKIQSVFDLVYFDKVPIDDVYRRVKELTSTAKPKRKRRLTAA